MSVMLGRLARVISPPAAQPPDAVLFDEETGLLKRRNDGSRSIRVNPHEVVSEDEVAKLIQSVSDVRLRLRPRLEIVQPG
jgi:hypothetical protein